MIIIWGILKKKQFMQKYVLCCRYKVIVYSATGGGGGGGGRRGGASRGGGQFHSSARFTCAMLHIVIIWGLSVLLSLPLIFAMELG